MSYTGKTIDLSKYDKYGKEVELSKVEVELSGINTLKSWINRHEEAIKKLKSFKKEKDQLQKEARAARAESFKEAQAVIKIAENLGLKGKDIPEVVELFRISKEVIDLAESL